MWIFCENLGNITASGLGVVAAILIALLNSFLIVYLQKRNEKISLFELRVNSFDLGLRYVIEARQLSTLLGVPLLKAKSSKIVNHVRNLRNLALQFSSGHVLLPFDRKLEVGPDLHALFKDTTLDYALRDVTSFFVCDIFKPVFRPGVEDAALKEERSARRATEYNRITDIANQHLGKTCKSLEDILERIRVNYLD